VLLRQTPPGAPTKVDLTEKEMKSGNVPAPLKPAPATAAPAATGTVPAATGTLPAAKP
jgi:hypothetical protein